MTDARDIDPTSAPSWTAVETVLSFGLVLIGGAAVWQAAGALSRRFAGGLVWLAGHGWTPF